MLVWLALLLVLNCSRERRNPLDPETSLVKERLSPPATIVATPGKGLVRLQWTPVSSRLLAGYALFRSEQMNGDYVWVRGDGDAGRQITTSRSVFVDSVGLPVKTYFYHIASVDTTGALSRFSQIVAATPLDDQVSPTAPLNLSVMADERSSRLIVRWNGPLQDVDGSELSGLAGYVILRAEANRGFLAPVDTVDAQTLEYIDDNLKAATLYAYAIQAFDRAGNYSPPSLSVQARTQGVAMPTGVQAVGAFGQVVISWSPILEEDLWGYNVYRSRQSDAGYERLGAPDSLFTTGTPVYIDSSVTSGERFYYKVSGISPRGESELSLTVSAVAQADRSGPGSPAELVGVGQMGQVELRWSAPLTDRDGSPLSGLASYVIYRGESQTSLVPIDTVGVGVSAYDDAQVEGTRTYYYGLVAIDGSGNASPLSGVVTVSVPGLLPPQGVEVTGSIGRIQVSWQASGEEELLGYNVYRSSRSDGGYQRLGPGAFTTGETVFVDSTTQAGQLYFYRVTAVGAGVESRPSIFRSARALEDLMGPASPEGLVGLAQVGRVQLRWSAPLADRDGSPLSGLASYVIYRGESQTSLVVIDTVGVGVSAYDDAQVEGTRTYYYGLVAIDGSGNASPLSGVVTVSVPGLLPPQGVEVTGSIGRIQVSWQASGEEELLGYNVYRSSRSDGDYQRLGPGAFTTGETVFVDSTTQAGQLYFYRVTAVGAGLESKPSIFRSARALEDLMGPASPEGLVGLAQVGRVQLRWSAPLADRDGSPLSGLASYVIYRGESQTSLVAIDTVGVGVSAYDDAQVEGTLSYYYSLVAIDGSGNASPLSAVVAVQVPGLSPPQGVAVSGSIDHIQVSWQASGEEELLGYNVYRSSRSDGGYERLGAGTFTTGETVFVDSTTQTGQLYFYRVTAVGAGVESRPSIFRSARALEDLMGPASPAGLVGGGQVGRVQLRWSAPLTDRDGSPLSGLASYVIYRGESQTSLVAIDTVEAAEETYVDQSVEEATTYFYAVAALDGTGHSSPLSSLVSATTPGILPVSGLAATGDIEQIELRWDRNLNDDLSGYNVYRATRSNGVYARLTGNEGTSFTTGRTAYIDSNLTGGQVFFYKVSAVTIRGESALSEFAGVATLHDTRPPAAPELFDLAPVANLPGSLRLSWRAPVTDVGGATLTGLSLYQIYRAEVDSGPFLPAGNSTSTSFSDTALADGTTYYYQVEALDKNGNAGPRSTVLFATTAGVSPPHLLKLTISTPSDTTQALAVLISWDAPEGRIAQYEVQRTTVANSSRDQDYVAILPHTADTSRLDDTVELGRTYYYRVRARDAENRLSDWTLPYSILVSP